MRSRKQLKRNNKKNMKRSNKKVKQSRRKMTRKLRKGGVWYNPRSWFKKSVKVAPVIGPTSNSPYNPNLSNENTRLTPDLVDSRYTNDISINDSLYSNEYTPNESDRRANRIWSKNQEIENNCKNINFFNIQKKMKCRKSKKQLKELKDEPVFSIPSKTQMPGYLYE